MLHGFCKVFVNCADRSAVARVVRQALGSAEDPHPWTVSNGILGAEVRFNPDHGYPDASDAFLTFPCLVEIDPAAGKLSEEYMVSVHAIVSALREQGWEPVPACAFEEWLK